MPSLSDRTISYSRKNDPFVVDIVHKVLDDAATLLIANMPAMKEMAAIVLETIFVPRAIAKQLVLLLALEAGMVTIHQVTAILSALVSTFSSKSRLLRSLHAEQAMAATQDEWIELAERIDAIQGNDVWRTDPACALYERDRITARIDEYVHLMRRGEVFELMFVLRGSIGRNKFGLLHEGLFSKAMAGTKVLVETYHNVVCAALDFVCDAPVHPDDDPIPTDARLAFFNETRHAYGRTALLLSGGAALGFYHGGVVKALLENNLMPRVLGGSSAGSIVCAMIGTRTDEECIHDLFELRGTHAPGHSGRLALNFFRPVVDTKRLEEEEREESLLRERRRIGRKTGGFREVYYNTAGAFHDAKRTLQGLVPSPLRHFSSFLFDCLTGYCRPSDIFKKDTEHFRECVRTSVGNFTFQEAFDRTGRILNIVVTPKNSSDPPRLLNYLTAPHVLVWSAAVASSSLPGVFEANRLVVKEADGLERYESGGEQHFFSDGSMEQDLPMQQLSEMFNINHFIISQANVHAVLFASYSHNNSVWTNPMTGLLTSILSFLKNQVRSWLMHLVQCVGARRIAPLFDTQRGTGTQLLVQEYEGRSTDISLIPWFGHRSVLSALLHIIYNPSEAEFREWIEAAEKETWKYIPAIKSHIAEEITLDRCVQRLRHRLNQESWGKHKKGATASEVGDRVPSFFTSPSLIQLSGLGVADQPSIDGLQNLAKAEQAKGDVPTMGAPGVPNKPAQPKRESSKKFAEIEIAPGWAGLGLRGNRSSGNLHRSQSDASGLFIDDDEAPVPPSEHQEPGERTENIPSHPQPPLQVPLASTALASILKTSSSRPSSAANLLLTRTKGSDISLDRANSVKTSSMARFYYRKTGEYDEPYYDRHAATSLHKTTSHPVLERENTMGSNSSGGDGNNNIAGMSPTGNNTQRKSKSHADLKHSRDTKSHGGPTVVPFKN